MPNEFEHVHIELIRQLPMSAIIGAGEPANWSRAFWLVYFWQEAITVKSEFHAKSANILAFFNWRFRLPDRWNENAATPATQWEPEKKLFDNTQVIKQGGVWAYRGNVDGQTKVRNLNFRNPGPLSTCPNNIFHDFLQALLESGFKRIPAQVDGLNPVQNVASSIVFNAVRLQNPNNAKTFQCSFGWRGDNRSFEELDRAGGFRARADSITNGFAESCGLREQWHPFRDVANRSDYWYRKGQEDNCLHTSVSIATDFRTATVFPLLENKLHGKKIPTTGAEATQQSSPKAEFCKVITHAVDGTAYRYSDQVTLYLVLLNGSGFATQSEQQEKFPELAVKFVDASSLLASITFTRVFHGLTGEDGFTALFNRAASKAPTLERCRAAVADDNLCTQLYNTVFALFNNTAASMPYAAKWIPGGSETVKPFKLFNETPAITHVKCLNGTQLWP